MTDFILADYKNIIIHFLNREYTFYRFQDYINNKNHKKNIIFRHDVDRLPENALKVAEIENKIGIQSSYYFRAVNESFNENIIKQIAGMGHEIGYHYEEMDIAKGNKNLAIQLFEENIEKFRKLYPVKTICMHGSPLSKFDNRSLWEEYDYRGYGIIGEPYFDLDFDKVFYITDTGRKWNNDSSSVRDKVDTKFNIEIKNTHHLIELIKEDKLPDQLMINTHPQRWFDFGPRWVKEFVWQNTKNVVKKYFFVRGGNG